MAFSKKRCELCVCVCMYIRVYHCQGTPFTHFPCSTKRKFGDEYFRFFLFMVMVQCVINAIFARVGQ